jgi:hypothetical protein
MEKRKKLYMDGYHSHWDPDGLNYLLKNGVVVVFLISQNSTVDAALDNVFFAWIDQLHNHFHSI